MAFTNYEKTLYIQRLLYQVESERTFFSQESAYQVERLKDAVGKELDACIESLQHILEITGFFPEIREIHGKTQERIWKQPTKQEKKAL